jgi:hypothetical protein
MSGTQGSGVESCMVVSVCLCVKKQSQSCLSVCSVCSVLLLCACQSDQDKRVYGCAEQSSAAHSVSVSGAPSPGMHAGRVECSRVCCCGPV